MERCRICDSTDSVDTQEQLGIFSGSKLTFSREEDGEVLCSRCRLEIQETLGQYETFEDSLKILSEIDDRKDLKND